MCSSNCESIPGIRTYCGCSSRDTHTTLATHGSRSRTGLSHHGRFALYQSSDIFTFYLQTCEVPIRRRSAVAGHVPTPVCLAGRSGSLGVTQQEPMKRRDLSRSVWDGNRCHPPRCNEGSSGQLNPARSEDIPRTHVVLVHPDEKPVT